MRSGEKEYLKIWRPAGQPKALEPGNVTRILKTVDLEILGNFDRETRPKFSGNQGLGYLGKL